MSTADVSQLPLREKLQIMEVIWEDLRARADRAGISQEQKDLLDARRARVASGGIGWHRVRRSFWIGTA